MSKGLEALKRVHELSFLEQLCYTSLLMQRLMGTHENVRR